MYTYLLYDSATRKVKIGKTNQFSKRWISLRGANLSIQDYVVFKNRTEKDEEKLHYVFSSKTQFFDNGGQSEWFDLNRFDILVIYEYFNHELEEIKGDFFDLTTDIFKAYLKLPFKISCQLFQNELTLYQDIINDYSEKDCFGTVLPNINIIHKAQSKRLASSRLYNSKRIRTTVSKSSVSHVTVRPKHPKVKYKGVSRPTKTGKYVANIYIGTGKVRSISLGTFATAEEAARAYDVKAKELYGSLAYLNFPDE